VVTAAAPGKRLVGCGCRPLLLTLGLQKHDAGTMKAILQLVDANKVW
jgi:hypothetical protein